ncbi:polysaccharide deacetylase family protein [Marinobacter changyiensis]|uniref:polysaccharide deacetylase family protein n=1 Tax=Marinobacter changyiensis TaxID=2604091 RepID=UPI0015D2442E|nr:polysaccharide deacetylase family protein [Marinobacter changyiensis]
MPVFLLHRFADESRGIQGHSQAHLETALTFLKTNGYTVVSVRQVVEAVISGDPLPPRAVAFTLDDGFYDQAKTALPVFENYQAPVTLFLATDMQDQRYWSWDYKIEYLFKHTLQKRLEIDLGDGAKEISFATAGDKRLLVRNLRNLHKRSTNQAAEVAVEYFAERLEVNLPKEAPDEYQPITWEQARSLESRYVEFGPHTQRHPILAQISDEQARNEILGSWQALKVNIANPVPIFCYPSGREGVDFGAREQEIVKQAGLIGALSADPGYVHLTQANNNLYALKRFSFPNDMTQFKQYCSWLEYAKEKMSRR